MKVIGTLDILVFKIMSNADSNKQFGEYIMGQNHVIEGIWLKYNSSPQSKWITKIGSAIKLHNYLKELQPKHILELGTGLGCSTEIMAFTCPEASIYTVEQSQKCIDMAKKLIPEKLQEQIYFRLCKVAVLKPLFEISPYIHFMAYSTPYDWRNYDFIYIDGPGPIKTLTKDDKGETWEHLTELPGGDIFLLLPKLNEGTIIYVDQRQLMVHYINRFLSHYFDLVENDNKHTVFRKNDRFVKPDLSDFMNSDLYLKALKEGDYFNKYENS